MATIYEIRFYCVACHYRWGGESRKLVVHFTGRKCRSCGQHKAKVSYLGRKILRKEEDK